MYLGNNPDAGFPVNALCNTVVNSNSSSSFDALLEYVQSQQAGACLDVNSVGDILVPGASRYVHFFSPISFIFLLPDYIYIYFPSK